jgi:hypothetical protein
LRPTLDGDGIGDELWHHRAVPGLLRALIVAVVFLSGMTSADAQAYRPRGKTPSTKSAAGAKKAGAPTRAPGATPRRVVTTRPADEAAEAPKAAPKAKAKGKAKGKGKEDIVIVDDDDDDSIQIKDD